VEKTGMKGTTHADVRVRAASDSDRDFVLDLVPELSSFGPPSWRDHDAMVAVDRRVVADALGGRLPGSLVFVAETGDGERLGFVHVCEENDYYGGPCGHIADIVVATSARGRGVGRALIAAAERWAREAGYGLLTLNVFLRNEGAARAYEATGFEAETTRYVKPLE
jgi:GNAT superfamily N-acetyltransferase